MDIKSPPVLEEKKGAYVPESDEIDIDKERTVSSIIVTVLKVRPLRMI